MGFIERHHFDHFSVLFWNDRLLLGARSFPLGQVTTDYLNLDDSVLEELRKRIADFVSLAHRMTEQKDRAMISSVQEGVNAVFDLIFTLPPYRDLPMALTLAYHMFLLLGEQPAEWEQAMIPGTENAKYIEKFLSAMETLPERLESFRGQVAGMLEFHFEDIPKRNPSEYARAFAGYYKSMQAMAPLIFPDGDIYFEQSFEASIRFVPRRDPDAPDVVIIGEETEFNDLLPFLYADFYRGLIHGNIPRRCHNCGRYFLLTAGYNTCYCNNIAPGETERTCRKVGAHRKEAQGKENRTPAQKDYARTYNRLKVRKQRGKLSVDEWNAAVAHAQELLGKSERGELTDEELRAQLDAM